MVKTSASNPVRFIHTGDWQIGKPYARIGDTRKRSLLQLERIEAIKRIGGVAEETSAQFVVVAGDLFDSPNADRATVSMACSAIGQIEIPVIVIPGNHDHGGPGSIWTQAYYRREQDALAPNLVVLLEEAPYELDSTIILPCPLLHRSNVLDPTAWLRSDNSFAELTPGKPRIVLAHGTTQDFTTRWDDDEEAGASSNLINLGELPDAEVDYVALGDWHGTKQVGAKAWYSGTPELDRFPKGGEHDPGNILIVDVQRGESPVVTSEPTGRINWLELSFDFADDTALTELDKRLTKLLAARTNEDLLRLSLSGSIGIETTGGLEQLLDTMKARLLRLKLDNRTVIAPTHQEIEELTLRASDPLITQVAKKLVDTAEGTDENALIAQLALRELHAACNREVGA